MKTIASNGMNLEMMRDGIAMFLDGIDSSLVDDTHTKDTPERVARAWTQSLMSGYQADPASILSRTFPSEGSEMIVIKDIPFVSMCAHHMLPFYGTARIGYVPGKEIVGLSKLARLLDAYAHRLQIQERLTQQVAQALEDTLAPLGVGVAIEAEHLCMTIRGVRKPGAKTVTSALRGVFLKPETRQEFLSF